MTDPADGWPRGRHAKAGGGQRPPLMRYRWYGAALAGAATAALAAGALILMNSHDGHPPSNDCGLVSCSAALPESTSAMPQGSPQGKLTARPAPAHHHVTAAPAHAPSPSASATLPPVPPSPSASSRPPASRRAHGHSHAGEHHVHGHG